MIMVTPDEEQDQGMFCYEKYDKKGAGVKLEGTLGQESGGPRRKDSGIARVAPGRNAFT